MVYGDKMQLEPLLMSFGIHWAELKKDGQTGTWAHLRAAVLQDTF